MANGPILHPSRAPPSPEEPQQNHQEERSLRSNIPSMFAQSFPTQMQLQATAVNKTATSTDERNNITGLRPAAEFDRPKQTIQQHLPPSPPQLRIPVPMPYSPTTFSPDGGLRLETSYTTSTLPRSPPPSRKGSEHYLGSPPFMARSLSYGDSLSPISAVSPALSATSSFSASIGPISKMTPLPSPISGRDSPGPWNNFRGEVVSRTPSVKRPTPRSRGSALVTASGESLDAAFSAQLQRKALHGLRPAQYTPHGHSPTNTAKFDWEHANTSSPSLRPPSRSNSRNSCHERSPSLPQFDVPLHRETWQGVQSSRRRTSSFSSSYVPSLSGSATSISSISSSETAPSVIKKQKLESFYATSTASNTQQLYRGLRIIGHGAFSKVILATSEPLPEEVDTIHPTTGEITVNSTPVTLNPALFVAVKIVERSIAGPDQKERVESGLKRELDILKSVHHPCLIHLRAWAIEPKRALIVLPYCAGGDLFDVASSNTLAPSLIRRIFAEIVSALRYLHTNGIVHRDVKLENVLINLNPKQLLAAAENPTTYPYPITTLTDVGLSRRINLAENELLTTRCGSDDYASPELIMSMPYDGRQTDAWALGVLLFALIEERLPFDPPSGSAETGNARSKTAHRIARCEWKWAKLQEAGTYSEELEGAKRLVTNLLMRARKRWTLEKVGEDEWVTGGLDVEIVPHPAVGEEEDVEMKDAGAIQNGFAM